MNLRHLPLVFGSLLFLGLGACALSGPLREDAKASGHSFKSPPTSSWHTLDAKSQADNAWSHRKSGATLALSSVCHRYEHISIQSLSRNLINTVQNPEIISQGSLQIAGRDAASLLFSGTVDGVEIQSRVVVMRKDHCIFDFTVSQLSELSPEVMTDFDAFLSSFRYEGGVKK